MKATHRLALILVIIGGLNWLLVGLFSWDIGRIFGGQSMFISRVIYILVGLSAIYLAAMPGNENRMVEEKRKPQQSM